MSQHLAQHVFRRGGLAFWLLVLSSLGFPAWPQTLKGVNLSGAEFAGDNLPGVYGQDYIYPNNGEVDYFTAKGMNVFRVPVLWERLQPALNGPLDPQEIARLTGFIAYANQKNASVIIDVHNYGLYRGVLIGDGNVTDAAFADLWRRLAVHYGKNDKVFFGLMNEPKLQQTANWRDAVQAAITAIRATGARNPIFVSGIDWDGADGFAQVSGNSLRTLADPRHRLVFEVHQYFDGDASGTSASCIDSDQAVERLASFTQWLRVGKKQGFLGEFAVSRQAKCLAVLDRVVSYLHENSDVWLGWTYWAAGSEWGDYMFTLEPENGKDRPQMLVLQKYLKKSNS